MEVVRSLYADYLSSSSCYTSLDEEDGEYDDYNGDENDQHQCYHNSSYYADIFCIYNSA